MMTKSGYRTVVCAIATVMLQSACTSQQWYDAIRTNRVNDCMELTGTAYDDCVSRYEMSYREYRLERARAMEN